MNYEGALPPTITVARAAQLLGIGRRQAYEAVHRGEIPSLRVGRRLLVPTHQLLELLGLPADELIRLERAGHT
jgi:excisionase family DNA binding protein